MFIGDITVALQPSVNALRLRRWGYWKGHRPTGMVNMGASLRSSAVAMQTDQKIRRILKNPFVL
jgi:hypothetical protein